MVVMSLTVTKIMDFKPIIYTSFLKFDYNSMRLVTDFKELFALPFALFVSYFTFIGIISFHNSYI